MTEFSELVKKSDVTKPLAIVLCDDGPDEDPRFPKTLDISIQHFKEYDFDAMLASAPASVMSVYNNVKRRIAPLSKAVSPVILPQDAFGTHLDSQTRTISGELEEQNFKAAKQALTEILSKFCWITFLLREYIEGDTLDPIFF